MYEQHFSYSICIFLHTGDLEWCIFGQKKYINIKGRAYGIVLSFYVSGYIKEGLLMKIYLIYPITYKANTWLFISCAHDSTVILQTFTFKGKTFFPLEYGELNTSMRQFFLRSGPRTGGISFHFLSWRISENLSN